MVERFFQKMVKVLIVLIGAGIGAGIVAVVDSLNLLGDSISERNLAYLYVAAGVLFGLIFFFLSKVIISTLYKISTEMEKRFQNIPTTDVVLGAIGLVVGFVIAFLLSGILTRIPYVGLTLSLIAYIIFGYFGLRILTKKRDDFGGAFERLKNPAKERGQKSDKSGSKPKILDTSVIIDGRIFDIAKAGFIEGPVVIPEFVLKELQYIADSADSLKRAKGRRGLDVLNKIQKELDIEVIVTDKDFEEVSEVDLKLLRLAQALNGKVVTNDYNLNKVAEVHGVAVLNINELSNAVKPIAIPGEEMHVHVIKVGKESGQGIAYLDDGTMIVVEGGKSLVGKKIDVVVTSVIQTPAGRMIFGKPKELLLKEGN
ncbi:putative PIN and TRAM-domain containing protein precursor [Andreesenia angusta]|uniref:Putative PIN and TRAM-domain containing protein n=1 Tax=Andreesenia angusta TaxID=39480 RepID=A0A1S1V708_9FIRM|nr:PIN/TRAM domain-containing protein [Andreesenia angusta]OHW62391.1 putative PIN and TRAM-domain containing protein precursor [Andreesenia angusta]